MPPKCTEILSQREKEILKHFCFNNAKIGEILHIAEGTVKTHSHNIMDKLNAKSRTTAIIEAIKRELITANEVVINKKE